MSIIGYEIASDLQCNMEDEEDNGFSIFEKNHISSPMNDEDRRKIKEIECNLINSLKEYSSLLTCTSNNLSQQNMDDTRNIEEQQQSEQTINNNSSSTNSDVVHMDADDSLEGPQQISPYADATTDVERCYNVINENYVPQDNTTQREQTSQPSTTDNTNAVEQQMNLFEYWHQFLEKFRLGIEIWEPVLRNMTVSTKTTDYYLKEFPFPSPAKVNTNGEEQLNELSEFFQAGIHLLPSFRQRCNTGNVDHADLPGKESNETSERNISAPSEHNGNRLNRDIRATKQSKLPTSTISKDANTAALSLSLSQLLSQATIIVDELSLIKLNITEEPREHWTKRTINCLKCKWSACIQDRSGIQQHYPRIRWSKTAKYDPENVFVLVQVLSYDGNPHLSNIIVPAGTTVKQPKPSTKRKKGRKIRSTFKDLGINNDAFDEKTRTIRLSITPEEYLQCEKDLPIIMFSSYKSEQPADTDDVDGVSENEESDENEEPDENGEPNENEDNGADSSIEDEIGKLSKLRIRLCQLTRKDGLKYISNFVDTQLIEETKGSVRVPLSITNSKELRKNRLCNDGKELIYLIFSKNTDKKGLVVHLTGEPLEFHKIHGVKDKQIYFDSVPNTIPGQNYLRVQVWKKSILETIKRNLDPYDGLYLVPLLDVKLYYENHNGNQHVYEHSNTRGSIQSNEIGPTQSLI